MMRIKSSLIALLLTSSAVQAEDAAIFGNVHIGVSYSSTSIGNDNLGLPMLNIGGKASFEPADQPIGFQIDLDANYMSLGWLSPSLPAEGSLTNIIAVGHGTYEVNNMFKVGAYGGYEKITIGLTKVTDPTYDFLGETGLAKASVGINVMSGGTEALYTWDGRNSLQARVGIVVPSSIELSATDTAGITDSASAPIQGALGVQLGFGIRNDVTDNFSMRADANLTAFGNLGFMNTVLTGQYLFEGVPIAASASVGYQSMHSDSDSAGGYMARTGLSYSFGGPTETTRGKLFRSSTVMGSFN
jgi:hypothetical protein